ncbi:hypothetical protein [Pseudobacillus wudalianchiensis]|uniref:hypothetical protein n=1 Tax=Pseudobacillus wudalianchiensis TaxID=1743143 RepID=UPI001FE14B25|nr:hypothetical protein [Bacillus wudalianchiensis]
MRWTKTKALLEHLLCEKLKKRLNIYTTSYHAVLGEQRRIWVTFNQKEVFQTSSAQFLMEHDKLWKEIRQKNKQTVSRLLV